MHQQVPCCALLQSDWDLKKRRTLKLFGIVWAALAFMGVGILCGYFISKAANRGSGSNGGSSGGSAGVVYKELPPPGTAEAQVLIDDPETPGKHLTTNLG